jgi:hypothetical protein
MPYVKGKKFPYTPTGKAAAKAALKKMVGNKKDGAGGPGMARGGPGPKFRKLQKMMPLKDQMPLKMRLDNQLPLKERLPNLLPKKKKDPETTPMRGYARYA